MLKQTELFGRVLVFGQYFYVAGPTTIQVQISERFNHELGWRICDYCYRGVDDTLRSEFLSAPWDDQATHRADFDKQDLWNTVRVFN